MKFSYSYLLLIPFLGLTKIELPNYEYWQKDVSNYLSLPNNLEFENKKYDLSFSSHPAEKYYKQEYLPKGEYINHFSNLLFVDAILSDTLKVIDVVTNKIAELEILKKTNPIINYKSFNNPDKTEYIIDFLTSNSQDDKVEIVEWNAYKIKAFTDKNGVKGVMLLAVSKRAYDNKVTKFLTELKDKRMATISALIKTTLPEITIPAK